jgi:citrate synthase
METYTPKMTADEMKEEAEFIADCLKEGGKLLVSITHVSPSNMSYRYKVILAYVDEINPNELMFNTLSYWMAAEMKTKVVAEYAGDTLKGHGVGFDRYHDAAYTVGQILAKYGLVNDPLKTVAIRGVYREI